jgi:hypothetical protein
MTDEEAIRILVDAAPPLPPESERIMAGILGPAYARLLEREAAEAAAARTEPTERAA